MVILNGLFQAIMKLLDSPDLRRKMGLKGRQIVMNNFTDKIVISETTDVWEELI